MRSFRCISQDLKELLCHSTRDLYKSTQDFNLSTAAKYGYTAIELRLISPIQRK